MRSSECRARKPRRMAPRVWFVGCRGVEMKLLEKWRNGDGDGGGGGGGGSSGGGWRKAEGKERDSGHCWRQ
ncbi:hypothetical protein M0804_007681 [Polistes exclamans]|nr:hypothetical protein M0804_007681 [Polistes exclamans]